MNAEESSYPQVVFISAPEDRERIRPLFRALEERRIKVWWDRQELATGQRWEPAITEAVKTASLICLIVSKRSLTSIDPTKWVELATRNNRRVVLIGLDPEVSELLPPSLVDQQGFDFLAGRNLETIREHILHTLKSIETGDESRTQKAPRPSKSAPSSAKASSAASLAEGIPMPQFLLGDEEEPEPQMAQTLRDLLVSAAGYRRDDENERRFPVSFRTVMMALFYAAGQWSQWAMSVASNTGFDYASLGPLPLTPQPVTDKVRVTRSIATLLRVAQDYALQANRLLNVQHIIGAVIFAPDWHEKDLERLHFEKLAWANELVREAERLDLRDAAVFRALRDSAFPVSGPPPNNPQQQSNIGIENAPAQASSEATAGTDIWSIADPELRSAFALAAAYGFVRTKDPGPFAVSELFVAIVKQSKEVSFAALAEAFMPKSKAGNESIGAQLERKLGVSPGLTASPVTLLPSHTAAVAQALTKAVAMRTGNELLSCTLVFLALLKPDTAGGTAVVDPLLSDLGVDVENLLEKLRDDFKARNRSGTELITEVLELRRSYQAWDRPHVDNDFVEGAIPPDRDLLDARKPALRFAKLLAARDVQPPIALGLFGNWGSGKTFFMGLMRDRIADLSKNGGNGYVRRVVQIEFNAWHYHDTNLWASVAMRIFEGLAKELGGKKPSEVEKKRKELHQKIRSSASRRDEAIEQRDQALERRSAAAKELESLRAQREKQRNESVLLQLRTAWEAVKRKPRYSQLQDVAKDLRKNFGIDAAVESVGQVRQLKSDVEDTRTHALGILTAIGRRFHGRSAIAKTVGGLVLLTLIALALGWGLEALDRIRGLNLPRFSGTIIQIATLVSTITAWCGCRVRELRGAMDTIAAVEADLSEAEKNLLPSEPLLKLEEEIAALDKQIHGKSEEVSAAEREIAEATAEIERINRGGLVYDFLQERSTAASYVGQLGLISTIRQDLERLDELLQDFAKNSGNAVERIILYIDDLDRCHPNKVVEVLQAVHLLLAFDLFNVVVGVDARWLERSLYRQYVGDTQNGPSHQNDPFSPQDYLEKIFQIPYALAPMDQTAFKNLVGGMIETRSEWQEKEREKRRQEELRQAEEAAKANIAPKNETESTTDTAVETPVDTPDQDSTKDDHQPTTTDTVPASSSEAVLFFEDHEQKFIELLFAFIDRPRLAKRFINIYRLLRVRADDEGESEMFAARAGSKDFRAALVLLAIHVGHPNVAAKVIQAIEAAKNKVKWSELLGALAAGNSIPCNDTEREEIETIIRKLENVGESLPSDLDSYTRWAPRVGCFSFDWHKPLPRRRSATVGN